LNVIFKKLIYWILFPFVWLACLNKSVKAMQISTQIGKLERKEKYDEARKLRKKSLLSG
jgi:hypothetical protein